MKQILLVSDEETTIELAHLMLRFSGFAVFVARNAEEVETLSKKHALDLVVADMRTGCPGERVVVHHVLEVSHLRKVPILVINGICLSGPQPDENTELQPISLERFIHEVTSFFVQPARAGRVRGLVVSSVDSSRKHGAAQKTG